MSKLHDLYLLVIDGLRPRPHPTHYSIGEAVAVARDLRPRRTLLTHMNHNVEYTRESAALPEGVGLAYDGLVVDLPDP
jgi:phosphoribosyl 1,2-cyclic phosphate phosphodiesterase